MVVVCSTVLAGLQGPSRPAPTRTQIADGVYLYQTAPYGPVGLDGNSIVVLSDAGVLVFDTNGTPSAAEAVLSDIRRLTDKPVRYVVNSHWHWDHWYGTEVYTRAFPDVVVIAHEKTRELMAGPAVEFNRPGLETQLPGFIRLLEQRLEDVVRTGVVTPDALKVQSDLFASKSFLEQKSKARLVLPALTFSSRLDLHLGNRLVQVLNFGRAVTPGDALVFLPAEKVLISGDLVFKPFPYALSVYPTEWLRALEQIDALDAAIIVPGHGEPMRDELHLQATMAVLRELLRQGSDAKKKGMNVETAKDFIFTNMRDLMIKMTGDSPSAHAAFKTQMVDWFLHRVYEEVDGPLTDAIAPIPAK